MRPVPDARTLLEGCAHSDEGRFGQWLCGQYPALSLAFWAKEGRPARLHDPRDRAAAFASLALAAIDAPVLREIAEIAFRATEVAQGRSARRDRVSQERQSVVEGKSV